MIYVSPLTAANTPGRKGAVSNTVIQSRTMDSASKQSYPLMLLRIMKRHAEDLLWANNVDEGRQVLRFIKDVSAGRQDAREFYRGKIITSDSEFPPPPPPFKLGTPPFFILFSYFISVLFVSHSGHPRGIYAGQSQLVKRKINK